MHSKKHQDESSLDSGIELNDNFSSSPNGIQQRGGNNNTVGEESIYVSGNETAAIDANEKSMSQMLLIMGYPVQQPIMGAPVDHMPYQGESMPVDHMPYPG